MAVPLTASQKGDGKEVHLQLAPETQQQLARVVGEAVAGATAAALGPLADRVHSVDRNVSALEDRLGQQEQRLSELAKLLHPAKKRSREQEREDSPSRQRRASAAANRGGAAAAPPTNAARLGSMCGRNPAHVVFEDQHGVEKVLAAASEEDWERLAAAFAHDKLARACGPLEPWMAPSDDLILYFAERPERIPRLKGKGGRRITLAQFAEHHKRRTARAAADGGSADAAGGADGQGAGSEGGIQPRPREPKRGRRQRS